MDGLASGGCRIRNVRPATHVSGGLCKFELVRVPSPLDGCAASASAETLPLLDGDSVVEIASSPREVIEVGSDLSQGSHSQGGVVVFEKQVLLRTTGAPNNAVLLKADRDIRVRVRRPPSSPSSRRARSPSRRVRPSSPPAKENNTLWASSSPRPPTTTVAPRASPPAKAARASPSRATRASPARSPLGIGGAATRIMAGAQMYLVVGETLDLGIAGVGRGYRCRCSYTLRLASSAPPPADSGGKSGARGLGLDLKTTRTPSSLSSGAGWAGSSGRGGGGGTKRRLEDVFADNTEGRTEAAAEAAAAAAASPRSFRGGSGSEEDGGGVQILPTPIFAIEIEDDDGGGRATSAAAAATPAANPPKRRTRDKGPSTGSTPFVPFGVVDLCDLDDQPVDAGKSNDQPLDLCGSDGEGASVEPSVAGEARPAPTAYSGGGGCRYYSVEPAEGSWLPPARRSGFPKAGEKRLLSARTDSPAGGGGGAGGTQQPCPPRISKLPAAPGAVEAGFSSGTSSTTTESDLAPASKASSAAAEEFFSREALQRLAASLDAPVDEKEENQALSPVSPGRNVAPSPRVDIGGDVAAGAPTTTEAVAPAEQSEPTAPRTLPRMDNCLRLNMKPFLDDSPYAPMSVVKELLARGTAPSSSLCDVIVMWLLQSRCRFRNEYLRMQLRAMLDVDPNVWSPPQDDAPGWLETLMSGVLLAGGSGPAKHGDPPPSDAALGGHAIVLKVVVDYLAAGRRCGGDDAAGAAGAAATERAMQFFVLPKQKGRGKVRTTPAQLAQNLAQHAVEKCAAWAAKVWGLEAISAGGGTAGAAAGTRAPKKSPGRRSREESPGLVRARLLAANFLAEVVEACGLPAGKACYAIVDQINSFSGVRNASDAAVAGNRATTVADAAAGAAVAGRGLLIGAAARGGLVRALLRRPFCAELALVLRADMSKSGDIGSRGDAGGDGRLRALLSRVLRRAEGGPEALLLYS